ncbi:MAG: glycogen synthase GlgA [Clostridiales bacterium]|nr:glycogen synthase GlgA [Clostridiales bacterium]
MKVLFCASECVPFVKTGGLADVAGALPVSLKEEGADIRVILPKYRAIDEYWKSRMEHVCSFEVLFGWEKLFCGVERIVDNGVTYYFIDNESYFYVNEIYGDGISEGLRFAFFSRAVLEALPRIDFIPDVLHLNDWQTGLIAALLKTQYAANADYARIRTVFSIHNLKYQGLFSWREISGRLGLDERYFTYEYLEFYGCISFMKGGLVFSDRLCTVSPTYAEEIKTPYFGENLDGLLRARENTLSGILNGLDYTIFNPSNDRFIKHHFDADSLDGKLACKRDLQRECGLEQRDVPLIGMIARLSQQKGLDLVERVLGDILQNDVQIVFLGKGDRRFVDLLNWANWRYPKRVHARIGLDEGLAHRIYAGADLFLMPSQFEPCGLSQMIALRYGCVPVVRETGGLKDTIVPYNMYTDEGNGFSFANYNAHEMLFTIERAVKYWSEDKPMWRRMVLRGMAERFDWGKPARAYLALYEKMLPSQTAENPCRCCDGEQRAEILVQKTRKTKAAAVSSAEQTEERPEQKTETPPEQQAETPAAQTNKK